MATQAIQPTAEHPAAIEEPKSKRGRPAKNRKPPQPETKPTARLSSEIENVLLAGDLSRLTSDQRLAYYGKLCETLGLNPYTQPFEYIQLSGKLQLYAKKNCTDQLRRIHLVSVDRATPMHDIELGIYSVMVEGHDRDNRHDVGIGAVNIAGLKGDMLANAMMKAETKAKRRFTLSLCGLGMLDESELESIGQVQTEPASRAPALPESTQPAPQPAPQVLPPKEFEPDQEDVRLLQEIGNSFKDSTSLRDLIARNKVAFRMCEKAKNPEWALEKLKQLRELEKRRFLNAAN